jgi:hypothetical protein
MNTNKGICGSKATSNGAKTADTTAMPKSFGVLYPATYAATTPDNARRRNAVTMLTLFS